ncbi:MAG: hypothetical protein ABI639_10540, partial [Thermoanaerobaculia bacterium]
LNADVYGFMELENTTPSASITDLLGAVNTRCGGAHPYAFVNTGGTLGTDAIRVQLIYRTGILSPVGSALVDLDPIHSRPTTAQTFDVVDAANPAFGKRFTVVANHFKSKGSSAGLPGDADSGDGAGASNATRTAQATRLLTWINGTVIPAAGDPDVLLLGDFNSYAAESPVTTITGGGYTDLETALLGAAAYSYLFDGQLGHLDYAFSSASLTPQITGVGPWHINADEADLFDYNDEVKDAGEATFEEKPDGSALVPPRVVFQPGTPYRASDHDPVLVGIFQVADLAITKTDSPDPVTAAANLTYTVTVTNNGPDVAATATWSDTLPAGTTFVSLPAVAGWSCSTPAIGAGGTVFCSNPTFAVGSAVFTLTVGVGPGVAGGTVISNTATTTSAAGDGNSGNNSATATTTVAASADLSVTKVDTPDPVTAGGNITYTITVANAGPSSAATVALSDTLPAGTTFVGLTSAGGWSCSTPAIGVGGTVTCNNASFATGNAVFTLVVQAGGSVTAGTVISNTAAVTSPTADPNSGNESATATTTVVGSADLSVTKVDTPDPVVAGSDLTYTITVGNAGPSLAASATLVDALPAGTAFVALTPAGGWSCTTPAIGGTGAINCTNSALATGASVFTLTVAVPATTISGTVLSNTATVGSSTNDPGPGNESATATTTVSTSADLSLAKVDTPDPVTAGNDLTYTITVGNAGPSAATNAALSDPLPAGTTFVSLASPGGWSCTAPAVGSAGIVNCSATTFTPGSAVFTLVVHIPVATAGGTTIANTASVSSATTDATPGNNSATASTAVLGAPPGISATKSFSGTGAPGGTVTYTIVITNGGPGAQADNAGDEFTDLLPAELELVSASATTGTTTADTGTGTVTWNGDIPALDSVTITIEATVLSGTASGTVVTNQGSVAYDSDGDGVNDATTSTDDPATGAPADATVFTVQQQVSIVEIPALDAAGLAALALVLAGLAILRLRSRRSDGGRA